MDLTNRSALVTGSSRGIGAAIARKLASRGAEVLVHGNKNSSTASQVVEQIKQTGGRASLVLADFSSPEAVPALFDSIGDKAAHLDILVNNAGIFEGGALEKLEFAQISRVLAVNVSSLMLTTREFVRRSSTEQGRIINISSHAGRVPGLNASLYSASKAAVDALTRCWAFEFGGRGITVNSVAPGMIDTEMSREGIQNRDVVLRGVALKRMGQVDDIADVVAFLACSESRWITGEVIGVTGGQVAGATILRTF